jgi:hypothetical protein
MPLTVAEYTNLMQHAIGGAPDARVVLLNVLNDALRFLFDSHPWNFRNRPVLPTDFGELLSVQSGARTVQLTSLEDIAHRRANASAIFDEDVYCSLSFPAQPTTTSLQNSTVRSIPGDTTSAMIASGPHLELHPTPAAADTFTIEYRAGAIQLVNTTDVPNIPPSFERVLGLIARAFLIDLEEQDASSEWEKANAEMERLKVHDGLAQQNLGPMRGGAVAECGRRVNFSVSGITAR